MDINAVIEQIKYILENLTTGSVMYYGGFLGVGLSVFWLLVCMISFPIKRKRVLRKLREKTEE